MMYLRSCDFDSSDNWIISDFTVLVYCFQEEIQGMHVKRVHDIDGIREIARNIKINLSCNVIQKQKIIYI